MTARSPAGAVPADAHLIASAEEALTIARAFAQAIAPGAVARDRDRELPTAELEQLGHSGLLALPVPRGHGGAQASRETVVEVLRIISAADPSIGQIPQNHLQLLDAITRYGDASQRELFFAEVLRGARFGNAWVERGTKNILEMRTRLRAAAGGDGYRLDGRKYYCTGALTAQWVPVAALDDDGHAVFAFVPRDAEGLTVEHDWSAFASGRR